MNYIFRCSVSCSINESAVAAKPFADVLGSSEGQFPVDLMNVTLMLPVNFYTFELSLWS